MMMDLAMHILDIVYNSIRAHARHIKLWILDSNEKNQIVICIEDDGDGMDEEMLIKVQDPFYTSRTTRKVGLGIPFVSALADMCEGSFKLESNVNVGTRLTLTLKKDHIDTPPWGDIGESIATIIQSDDGNAFYMKYEMDDASFQFDSEEIKQELAPVSIREAEVILWIKEYVNEGITALRRSK